MARPQNGVNGNLTQPHLGLIQHAFSINSQDQRNQSQAMYGYADISQVVQGHYVPQGYPVSTNHNVVNNIGPVSPLIAQPQYALFQYPNAAYQQSQLNQYQFPQTFIQPASIVYSQDNVNLTPVLPTTTRKCRPLQIVDPINNTDLDLSKYKVKPSTEKKTEEAPRALVALQVSESLPKQIREVEIKKDDKPEEAVVKDDIKHNNVIANVQIVEEKEVEIEDKESNDSTNPSIESIIERVDIEDDSGALSSNNDEDFSSLEPEKISPNYFLPVNKKDSDETTLRKKLTYDREYLITIKSNYRSQVKPPNLPTKCDFTEEIIYNESQNISCKKPESSRLSVNNNIKKQTLKCQGSSSYRKHQKVPPTKHIHLDKDDCAVLERLKSSYLPPQLRTKDTDPNTELKRNIKCNLNKITPQNFQDCLSEISKLDIKEKEEMSCLINEIFIKAVQEEAYSVTYAQFCNKLAEIFTGTQTFKAQLLKKCQEMFQTPIQEQLDNVRKEWVLKIENETDPKMKSLYESDLEEQVKRAKDRYFGNIRFIGELFLHQLLAGKIIINCIHELLSGQFDTDAILALCKLMETCGKKVEERHMEVMNTFIQKMDELSKSKELDTRMRFKLKDILDMRKRGWALRHIQQAKKIIPQTIEEQKEEAIAEAEQAAARSLAATQTSQKRNHHNQQNNTVRRQGSTPQRPLSFKHLSCASHTVDETTILGPVRSNWTAGSGLKSKLRSADGRPLTPQGFGNSSQCRDASPQVKLANKYRTLESSAEASGTDSRSSSPAISYPMNITKAYRISKVVKSSMTDDERADIIYNDLISVGSFDLASWIKIEKVEPVILKWIDDMMEKDVICRQSIGDKFAFLIQNKTMRHEQLINGSRAFLSHIDDLICDIPKLWEFFSQFLERFITDKNSDISFFEHIFKLLLPSDDVAHCISMTLHSASSRLGHNIVGEVFLKSSLKWDRIVRGDGEKFVKENALTFTIVGGTPLSPSGGCPLSLIADELGEMFATGLSNEAIFHFMEEHIDGPTWESRLWTKTVSGCIFRALKGMSTSMVREYLKDKSEFIKQISRNKIENEVEVLVSVQDSVDRNDEELLTIIYDVIMTGRVVSNEAFNEYRKDKRLTSEKYIQIISKLYIPNN